MSANDRLCDTSGDSTRYIVGECGAWSEGKIAVLKQPATGWARSLMDGTPGAATWCGWGIFAHNSVKLAHLAATKGTTAPGAAPPPTPPLVAYHPVPARPDAAPKAKKWPGESDKGREGGTGQAGRLRDEVSSAHSNYKLGFFQEVVARRWCPGPACPAPRDYNVPSARIQRANSGPAPRPSSR